MSRRELGFLLQQYLAGKCTEEEKKFVEHWFGIIQNEEREKLSFSDLEELEPLMWERIKSRTGALVRPVVYKRPNHSWKWALSIAASLLVLFAVVRYYRPEAKETLSGLHLPGKPGEWMTRENRGDTPLEVALPDGSKAVLTPGGSLRFPKIFSGPERQVLLTGEAFFEVNRMPEKPFLVYTGNLVTKVLGTSFHIKGNSEKGVSVEVVSGRVAVFERTSGPDREPLAQTEEVILLPNQKVVYFEERHELITGLVDTPQMLLKPAKDTASPSFVFEEVPMHTVLNQLEQAYGISIELENSLQNNCPLTADLSDLALFEQLEMICAATKSKYAVSGTSIVISGEGCSNLN